MMTMNDQIPTPQDASWDAMNEQHMHPFTEHDVIEALELLHDTLNKWHALRKSSKEDGTAMSDCGHDLLQHVGGAVLAFRKTCQRRRKELAAEYRSLAKAVKHRE
jgi:hypothetical protein